MQLALVIEKQPSFLIMRIVAVARRVAQSVHTAAVLSLMPFLAAAFALSAPAADVRDGDWPMPAHDYASTRFSPLDEINASNAGKLQLAFSFSTGIEKGHEAAPIVVNDTMYVVTPYPNHVFAFDLTRPGAHVKWKFDPKSNATSQGARRAWRAAMS
jgi:glucose dehydrogenase